MPIQTSRNRCLTKWILLASIILNGGLIFSIKRRIATTVDEAVEHVEVSAIYPSRDEDTSQAKEFSTHRLEGGLNEALSEAAPPLDLPRSVFRNNQDGVGRDLKLTDRMAAALRLTDEQRYAVDNELAQLLSIIQQEELSTIIIDPENREGFLIPAIFNSIHAETEELIRKLIGTVKESDAILIEEMVMGSPTIRELKHERRIQSIVTPTNSFFVVQQIGSMGQLVSQYRVLISEDAVSLNSSLINRFNHIINKEE
ncbi:MAG: hypothetical protein KDN22_25130 [Verrucomicrobiae bacterium]|nr:hypothetical protein [Verrucomicrobiae bacterium]